MSRYFGVNCLLTLGGFFTLSYAVSEIGEIPAIGNSFGLLDPVPSCPCSSLSSCQYQVQPTESKDRKVFVVSNGRKTWHHWRWDIISVVISIEKHNPELMCYTHLQNKQYGFVAKLQNFTAMESGTDLVWVAQTIHKSRQAFADYVVLDVLDVLHEENLNATNLAGLVKNLRYGLHRNTLSTRLICLLPWQPDHLGGDDKTHKLVLDSMIAYCDYFLTEGRSFLSPKESCRARASVPLPKLLYSVDEYLSQGLPVDKLYLGVNWHGYDYTCNEFDSAKNICSLATTTSDDGQEICDYGVSKKEKTFGELNKEFPDQVESIKGHQWQRYTMAPYFHYKDKDTGSDHQIWFEDLHSLHMKYYVSKDLGMGGVVIWTADDLNYDGETLTKMFDDMMWNNLKTAMYKPIRKNKYLDDLKAYPGKMAGVGVGCMILGTLLGFIIGVLVCARRQRTRLRPPFLKDDLREYQDDDPGQL